MKKTKIIWWIEYFRGNSDTRARKMDSMKKKGEVTSLRFGSRKFDFHGDFSDEFKTEKWMEKNVKGFDKTKRWMNLIYVPCLGYITKEYQDWAIRENGGRL